MNDVNYTEQFLHTGSAEPVLFETNAPMEKKHSYDFSVFNYTKREPLWFYTLLIAATLQILHLFASFAAYEISDVIKDLLLIIIIIFFQIIILKKGADDSFKSPLYNGNINNYKFYREYFVNTDNFTMSVIPYNILTDAHETKEYFFLFVSRYRAFVIPKNSFILNTPQGLREMLSINLENRFSVHCK